MVEHKQAAKVKPTALAALTAVPRWVRAMLMPVLAALAFWLVLPAAYRANEATDYETFYRPVAYHLITGQGFTVPGGWPALRAPPGYPVILAGVLRVGTALDVPESISLSLLTLACIALSSLFLYLMAKDVWGDWKALLPSALWSTYPLALWLTKQPNTEVPFTTILFATALVLWRLTRSEKPKIGLAVLIGVLAGLAMLVRPIALLFPLVLAGLVMLLTTAWPRWTRLVGAVVVVAMSLIVIEPWQRYAERVTGQFVLLSSAGVPSIRDGLTFGVNAQKNYRRPIYVPDFIGTVMVDFYAQYQQLDSFDAIARAFEREVRAHPVGTAGLVGMKLGRAWYGTDSRRLDRYIFWLQLFYVIALGWAGWRAWEPGAERRRLVLIAGAFIAYFWCMSVTVLPLVRYMVPALGLAFLLVPAAFEPRQTGV